MAEQQLHGELHIAEGDVQRLAAMAGATPGQPSLGKLIPLTSGLPGGRAIIERRRIHIADRSDPHVLAEFPEMYVTRAITTLSVPLLREDRAFGVMFLARDRAEPYTDHEIALVESFTDQAVIAIENARLFEELERRNDELQESNRQVTEALEQQTATAEVLKVISRSAFDLQPVLDTLVENARKLCGADQGFILRSDGEVFRWAADRPHPGRAGRPRL